MNKLLVSLGVVFTLIGAAMLASVLLRRPQPTAPASGPPVVVEAQRRAAPPSLAWSLGAGTSLALGAALVGIGMNRWRRTFKA